MAVSSPFVLDVLIQALRVRGALPRGSARPGPPPSTDPLTPSSFKARPVFPVVRTAPRFRNPVLLFPEESLAVEPPPSSKRHQLTSRSLADFEAARLKYQAPMHAKSK